VKRRDFLIQPCLLPSHPFPACGAAYALATEQATDVLAVTGDGREVTLKAADIRDLAARMRGPLLVAGDPVTTRRG
jgi:hypothetical protein